MMLGQFSSQSPSNHDSPKVSKSTSFNLFSLPHLPFWLITIVILQYFLLSAFFSHRAPPPSTHPLRRQQKKCENGKVFVYDLPRMFNTELLDNCNLLDPWGTKCEGVANNGFGLPATSLETVVPKNLLPAWYWTDMYIAEVIYHNRMLNYACRTMNPDEATAFYIPFYAGLSVGRYLYINHTAKERDQDAEMVLDWVKDQSSWKKRNGSDHFVVIGRLTWTFRRLTENDSDWGSKFILMPLMKNVLKLSVEKLLSDELEISIPYPTSFHPRSSSDISEWQDFVRGQQRNKLFCFVGATRAKIKNDFRGLLMNYCKTESGFCRAIDCSVVSCNHGSTEILKAFLGSDFCLQPKGDGATRRSFFDCMLAGSIPVYFARDSFDGQYQWHVNFDSKSNSSVFINESDVRTESSIIRKVLEGSYTKEEVKKMREIVIDMIPRFVYALSSEGLEETKDAFDIAIEGVLSKFHKQNIQQIAIP